MNCHEAARHLPGYLDGAIETPAESGLREHLASCHECHGQAERYRMMSRALANLTPVPVPSDLAVKIRIQVSKATPWSMWTHHLRIRADFAEHASGRTDRRDGRCGGERSADEHRAARVSGDPWTDSRADL
jgi:anti-sigma factor RsiW